MSFTYTYSREQLQGLQAEYRKEQLFSYIDNGVTNLILQAAREGKTQYFWVKPGQTHKQPINCHPAPLTFINEELIQGLKEKFPGVHVDYQYSWVETRPGVKEERKGILIDWS